MKDLVSCLLYDDHKGVPEAHRYRAGSTCRSRRGRPIHDGFGSDLAVALPRRVAAPSQSRPR